MYIITGIHTISNKIFYIKDKVRPKDLLIKVSDMQYATKFDDLAKAQIVRDDALHPTYFLKQVSILRLRD